MYIIESVASGANWKGGGGARLITNLDKPKKKVMYDFAK